MYFVRYALYPLYDLQCSCMVLNILNNTVEYQTCSQLPLIYSRKGIWQGNLMGAKVPVKEGEKALHFSSFLPLMHRNLTKSFPLITVHTQERLNKRLVQYRFFDPPSNTQTPQHQEDGL